MQNEPDVQAYAQKIKEVTPKFSSWKNCLRAFVSGGLICVLGEAIRQTALLHYRLGQENAYSTVSIILVLISVIFTGFQWFAPLTKWCGAGMLVPITGFANSVASPAIEYQKEGQVFGIGVKIFTIAGPVILYGIFSSWIIGLFYWLAKCLRWL